MPERITLAQFARNLGIAPATARQWKKRGKIIEVEGGFELTATEPVDAPRLYVRSSSGASPERIAELRQELERKKANHLNVARGEYEALLSRVVTLEAENKELRQLWSDTESAVVALTARVADLEAANPGNVVESALNKTFGKSNYTGSAASVGERFDDAPAPGIVW